VIAAGDDNNDVSMFLAADICIAMASAPEHLRNAADIIAPKASEMGIIQGLQQAINISTKKSKK
jgi:hydroxymethylpyrimidine pyrophosphatase-like HAD family hydrolase